MQPSSALQLSHGNYNVIMNICKKGEGLSLLPFFVSETHDAHFGGDAIWCGSDEEQPLCGEVWDYDHVAGMWDRLHEHVPCNDEVGEHEEDGS